MAETVKLLPLMRRERAEVVGEGVVLGTVLRGALSSAVVHSATHSHCETVKSLVSVLRDLHVCPNSFTFSSQQVLKSCRVSWHQDPNPTESIIVAFGDYSEGGLTVEADTGDA